MTDESPDQPPTSEVKPLPVFSDSLPPVDPSQPYEPWNLPPQSLETDPLRRAAILTWVIGGIEIVLGGCCTTLLGIASVVPPNELLRHEELPPEQIEAIEPLIPYLGMIAFGVFTLCLVPGVAYILLGFAVRNGRRSLTMLALLMAATQTLVLGLYLAMSVLSGLLEGLLVYVSIFVITFGSLFVVLLFTCIRLWRALEATRYGTGYRASAIESATYDPREPWDSQQR